MSMNLYECDVCSKKFLQKGNLIRHRKTLHLYPLFEIPANKNVKCDLCDKVLSHTYLNAHKKNIHSINDKECTDCGMEFKNQFALYAHNKSVHEEQKSFECDICSIHFASNRYLMIHKDTI